MRALWNYKIKATGNNRELHGLCVRNFAINTDRLIVLKFHFEMIGANIFKEFLRILLNKEGTILVAAD